MITGQYAHHMARYNRWQNAQLAEFLGALSPNELSEERGAFFGSILGTANHLLWGDWMWMFRFGEGDGPESTDHRPAGGMHESAYLCPDLQSWMPLREQIDARILGWSESLGDDLLTGSVTWYSAAAKAEVSMPFAECVVMFFNHQTHHRGQLHKMLTEAGSQAPVSDLVFMPKEG